MPTLSEQVFHLLCQVPTGRITTYKALAQALNMKGYQAIGQVLNKNPNAPLVPCHRVVKSDGQLGGYAFGAQKKQQLLEAEGITIEAGKICDFSEKLYCFV